MKSKLKLTDSRVRQLAAKDKEYVAWDNQLFGFGVRVRPSGYKAFILHGLMRGRIHKVTLGRFPVLSEAGARQACVDTLTRLQRGEPTQAGRISNAPRFDAFVSGAWHEQKFVLLKPTGQRSTLSYINARLLPEFGQMYLDEINKPGVAEWFDIYSKTYPGGANRSLEVLMSILAFAVVCGHLNENPAKGIRKNPKKVLNRFLSSEEIARLSQVIKNAEKESRDYRQGADIVRLLLLTGCRHREITLLQWSMIKGDTINLPDTKTGPRAVYLSKKAISILERQPGNGTPWVFPWIKDPKLPRNNIDQYWRDMRKRADIEDVRVHDLRHTFASHAVIKGVTIPMVSKLLGHRKTSMTLRYTHVSDKDTEAAAERIGATLRHLLDGTPVRTSAAPSGIRKRRLKPAAELKGSVLFGVRLSEADHAAAVTQAAAGGSGAPEGLSVGLWARRQWNNPPEHLSRPETRPDTRQCRKTKNIGFRVAPSQVRQYARVAEAAGCSVACWARAVLRNVCAEGPPVRQNKTEGRGKGP